MCHFLNEVHICYDYQHFIIIYSELDNIYIPVNNALF